MNYREQIEFDKYKVDVRAKLCDYDLSGEYGIGYTAQGDVFYFDKEDYEIIKDLPWHKSHNINYLSAHVRINGKRPFILMHRLIMDAPKELYVDHIGGSDTRNDNRKCNLRLATPSQNTFNSKRTERRVEKGARGVRYHDKRWEANITINNKSIYLGSYKSFESAMMARKTAENLCVGEYTYSNSQKESEKWRVV